MYNKITFPTEVLDHSCSPLVCSSLLLLLAPALFLLFLVVPFLFPSALRRCTWNFLLPSCFSGSFILSSCRFYFVHSGLSCSLSALLRGSFPIFVCYFSFIAVVPGLTLPFFGSRLSFSPPKIDFPISLRSP